jgi:hypothetical protein
MLPPSGQIFNSIDVARVAAWRHDRVISSSNEPENDSY